MVVQHLLLETTFSLHVPLACTPLLPRLQVPGAAAEPAGAAGLWAAG